MTLTLGLVLDLDLGLALDLVLGTVWLGCWDRIIIKRRSIMHNVYDSSWEIFDPFKRLHSLLDTTIMDESYKSQRSTVVFLPFFPSFLFFLLPNCD